MNWGTLFPTLVGGAISLISSVAMFWLAQGSERKKRVREKREDQIQMAYAGLHKLTATFDAIENLGRHLDREFEEAKELGVLEGDASSFIKPILGAEMTIENLSTQEISFLANSDGELVARIWEIQQRARNNQVIVREYNRFRLEYDQFLESRAHGIKKIDGTELSVELSEDDAKIAHLKVGRLNQLVVPLVVSVEEDRKAVLEIIQRYIDAAIGAFGDDFPAKRLEIREPKKC